MPWPRRGRAVVLGLAWLASLLLVAAPPALAQDAPPTLLLTDADGSLAAERMAQSWLDTQGSATLEDVLGVRMAPAEVGAIYPLAPGRSLWLRLRLRRGASEHQHWLLALPHPRLDQVTLWQVDEQGRWHQQSAGDRLAVNQWPEPGRYPVFRLELPADQTRDIYLQVRSAVRTAVPMRLSSDAAHGQQLQREALGLGIGLGALLVLVAACLVRSWAYRDRIYGWYALYAGIVTLFAAAYTGVAAQLLWPWSPFLGDAAPGALAMLSAGASTLLVRNITGSVARHPVLNRLASAAGWASIPMALLYLPAPRALTAPWVWTYVATAVALNIVLAWLAWRRRDPVGLRVLLAYLPVAAAVTAAIVRLLGHTPAPLSARDLAVAALVANVPLLLLALSLRTRDRHGAQKREQALSSQDALTGLLASHLFQDRLAQVVAHFKRDGSNAAVVFIELINHGRIQAVLGPAIAEQSLLRSVIKLRRVVHDVDTLGRIGEARFGLIIEGAVSRAAVAERAARLIAAGLMPLQGLKPEVTLQFHVAAVLLRERWASAPELAAQLAELLASMSPRTRRPIRFLEPETTRPAQLAADSEFAAAAPDPSR